MQSHTVEIDKFMQEFATRNPHEPLFHQAVEEVARSVFPIIKSNKAYQEHRVMERLTEPERIFVFSVPWLDRNHCVQINRGYRIQASTALGPAKGGLRFDPSVNLDVLKFLAFEQIFKNSNTGRWLGAGKGGSDFNPKDKTDFEVMSFCHAYMDRLYSHLGKDTDVPAGDMGVGSREIGYLFGHYCTLTNRHEAGVITGKNPEWGGSFLRPEATGYGLIYFVKHMLATHRHQRLNGFRVAISGAGNVAQYAAEKAIQCRMVVVSLSDRSGFIYVEGGITHDMLRRIMEIKNKQRGHLREYAKECGVPFFPSESHWQHVICDIALPCAKEDEILLEDARALIENGTFLVAEGANMPSSKEAIEWFRQKKILFAPGKAANAGGVAVSQLEMAQDGQQTRWEATRVDYELKKIMEDIHTKCLQYGQETDYVDYVKGANIAGFIRVADAMVQRGL